MENYESNEKILCSAVFDANKVKYKMLKNSKEKIALAFYYVCALVVFILSIDRHRLWNYYIDEYIDTVFVWFDFYFWDEFHGFQLDSNSLIAILITVAVIAFPFIIAGIAKIVSNTINKSAESVSKACELHLTETQIYGVSKSLFGEKQLRVPLEKLDNISIRNSLIDKIIGGKKLCILSNSGVVRFPYVQNSEEFMTAVFEQLEKRKNTATVQPTASETKEDVADELKKYKELLDSGIITQDEFDSKKKQILGL